MIRVNKDGSDGFTIDIATYSHHVGQSGGPQARYLVHGIEDSLWTNDCEEVMVYLKAELVRLEYLAPLSVSSAF